MMDRPESEQTGCLLCGSDRCSPVLEAPHSDDLDGPRFTVVCCKDCGLWYTNPRPTEVAIGRYYPEDYLPHEARRMRSLKRHSPGWHLRVSARLWRRCPDRRWLPPHGQMRLLDVGCGSDAFLQRMHHQGWDVTGLDVSETVVRRVRDELGLAALRGTLPHPELAPESFDVITMWQSLEHLHRPLDALAHARELLAPGGRLIVSVPNIEGLPFRWFGTAWNGLDLPLHLTHFTPKTLAEMIRRAGFQVEPVRMVRHGSWLRISARLAQRSSRARWWHRLLAHRPVRALLTWYCLVRGRSACITATATRPGAPD